MLFRSPGPWETLGHGGSAYALTTYRDRHGRLTGTAWLRGGGGPGAGWSGMLSLPVLLSARPGGGVAVAPHPDVDTLRGPPLPVRGGRCELDGHADLDVELDPGATLRLAGEPEDRGGVELAAAPGGLVVDREVRVPTRDRRLRVVVDRGVVEAWTADGRWIALRRPYLDVRSATVAPRGRLAAYRLAAGPACG